MVGSNRGYSIVKDLRAFKVKVKEFNRLDRAFKELKLGRLKALALHESEGDSWLKKGGFKNLKKSKAPLKRKYYYLLLSHKLYKSNRSLSNSLWKTLEELRNSRNYQKIKSRYLNKGQW